MKSKMFEMAVIRRLNFIIRYTVLFLIIGFQPLTALLWAIGFSLVSHLLFHLEGIALNNINKGIADNLVATIPDYVKMQEDIEASIKNVFSSEKAEITAVIDLLNKIPDDTIRDKAIANFLNPEIRDIVGALSPKQALGQFHWNKTSEGQDFWKAIFREADSDCKNIKYGYFKNADKSLYKKA